MYSENPKTIHKFREHYNFDQDFKCIVYRSHLVKSCYKFKKCKLWFLIKNKSLK